MAQMLAMLKDRVPYLNEDDIRQGCVTAVRTVLRVRAVLESETPEFARIAALFYIYDHLVNTAADQSTVQSVVDCLRDAGV